MLAVCGEHDHHRFCADGSGRGRGQLVQQRSQPFFSRTASKTNQEVLELGELPGRSQPAGRRKTEIVPQRRGDGQHLGSQFEDDGTGRCDRGDWLQQKNQREKPRTCTSRDKAFVCDTPGQQGRSDEPDTGICLHIAKCKHEDDRQRGVQLALADDNHSARQDETSERNDMLEARHVAKLAQEPDEHVGLAEQENGAHDTPIRDRSASRTRECLDQQRRGDRPEQQRYLQSNSVTPACEVDNRQEE